MHPRFVIFDVDDVLVDMDRLAEGALDSMTQAWRGHIGAQAEEAAAKLATSYDVLRRALRGQGERDAEHDALLARITKCQAGLLEDGFELKPWSRDSLAAIAFEDLGLDVNCERIASGVDAYWDYIADNTQPLEDARAYCDYLRERDVAMHCATNSDGFLRYDDARGTFVYDPETAVRRKHKRLETLVQLGLPAEAISVGDPHGKPSTAFAQEVLRAFKARAPQINLKRCLVVGDSWLHDLLPLLKEGVYRGAWIRRKDEKASPRPAPEDERVICIRSLKELLYLDINEVLL